MHQKDGKDTIRSLVNDKYPGTCALTTRWNSWIYLRAICRVFTTSTACFVLPEFPFTTADWAVVSTSGDPLLKTNQVKCMRAFPEDNWTFITWKRHARSRPFKCRLANSTNFVLFPTVYIPSPSTDPVIPPDKHLQLWSTFNL